jgi:beta-N-acetylhexosaminidase
MATSTRRPGRRARRRRCGIPAVLLAVTAAAAGCGAASADQSRSAPPSHPPSHPVARGPAAKASGGTKPAAAASCPAVVLSRMSEAQRAGQLFLVGLPTDQVDPATAAAIRSRHFGSVLFGTTSYAGAGPDRYVTSAVQSLASAEATAGVRFFVAANQEGGQVQALQGPGFRAIPAAAEQGRLRPAALQQDAAAWGWQLRTAGVNLNLAPVMDVVPPGTDQANAPIGALQREFGHDPGTVAAHGTAFARGMAEAGVAATAKHFPGLGRVRDNTDFSPDVVDGVTTPDDPYLQSFQAAVNAGVPFVMVSLATYARIDPQHLAVFSATVMRTILRQQMHFGGVIVSDDMGAAAAVTGVPPASRALDFVAAGGDLITSVSMPAAAAMDSAILARAGGDAAFRSEVDAAAARVLAAKQAYGLLPCPAQ